MDLSSLQLTAAMLLVFIGSAVQSMVGFGLAIVAAPLLFMLDSRLLPGPVLFLAFVLSAINLWKNRAGLAFGELGIALVARLPGMVLALWILTFTSTALMSLLIGGSVLAAIAISFTRIQISPTPGRLAIAGMVSGFMGTSTSIGGPPMALIYQHATGAHIRANLSGYFTVSALMSLSGLALIGRFGTTELVLSLWLLPPMLVGFIGGRYAIRWIGPEAIRPIVLILCSVAAAGVLLDAMT